MGGRAMGEIRNRAPRAVLPADSRRREAAQTRTQRIRAGHHGHSGDSAPGVGTIVRHAMRKLFRHIGFLFNRRRLERELAEEMEVHREMMPAERRQHFGNAARLREDAREAWSWPWLDQLWQDLCYGARVLVRAPGFTVGAVAVLALGVGVNLAEFQIFD